MEDIMDQKIWPSRLIFKAGLMYSKAYENLTEDERHNVHSTIITEQKERDERSRRFNSANIY